MADFCKRDKKKFFVRTNVKWAYLEPESARITLNLKLSARRELMSQRRKHLFKAFRCMNQSSKRKTKALLWKPAIKFQEYWTEWQQLEAINFYRLFANAADALPFNLSWWVPHACYKNNLKFRSHENPSIGKYLNSLSTRTRYT